MKKSVFTLALFAITVGSGQAQTVELEGLRFDLNKDTHEAMVESGKESSGELVIPATVSYNGDTYDVTSISGIAFTGSRLTKVTIPASVREIKSHKDRTGNVYYNPFTGCSDLKAIEVDKECQWLCSVSGVLFSRDMKELYSYPSGVGDKAFVVPDGIEKIGGEAFSFAAELSSVKLPKTLSVIGPAAFRGCNRLSDVEIGSLDKICTSAFQFCDALKKLELPASISEIEDMAFSFSSIERIVLPDGLKKMGDFLFIGCNSLKSAVLPSTTTEVSPGMFMNCSNLEEVAIPEGCVKVSAQAFEGCSSLRVIELPQSIRHLEDFVFKSCHFNALVIRGIIDRDSLSGLMFGGLDTSSTVYVEESMIDEFQKIYVGRVLPLEAYTPSGLSSLVSPYIENFPLHDLQGRRLAAKPQKGVYIQGGRKFVVR